MIGREVRDVAPEDAAGCIFGYTIWNDMSARDVQARELPIGMGPGKAKDWDGSNVLGPCIVTADELDASDLAMRVRVNGELWGEDTSAHMHHTFADMIAYASRSQTLYPGEVFGSGHRRRRLGPGARPLARPGRRRGAGDRGDRRAAQSNLGQGSCLKWPTSSSPSGPPRTGRRTGSRASATR